MLLMFVILRVFMRAATMVVPVSMIVALPWLLPASVLDLLLLSCALCCCWCRCCWRVCVGVWIGVVFMFFLLLGIRLLKVSASSGGAVTRLCNRSSRSSSLSRHSTLILH